MPAIWIPKRLVEISLINTAAESAQSFVTHCEIEYENRVRAAADEVLSAGARVVMLTGPSASGKTTTAHKLAEALTEKGHKSIVVSLDNFFRNLDSYPRLPDGSKDYENVTTLDIPEVNRCISELIETRCTDLPQFDFITEERMPQRTHIELHDGVAIIEGIHALNPQLTAMVKGQVYKIYAGLREEYSHGGQRVLPTRDVRLARRMVRDFKYRGHSPEKTIQMWQAVCDGEDKFIKVFKPTADLLLDTSFSYEVCCLAPFVASLQGTVPVNSTANEALQSIISRFALCTPIPAQLIPATSMLREFIG